MTHSEESIRGIIDKNQGTIAFLIGNGINRYNCSDEEKTNNWLAILQNLWKDYTYLEDKKYHFPNNVEDFDISYTEIYDVIKAHLKKEYEDRKNVIIEKVISDMESWAPKEHHRRIAETCMGLDIPILTTNFDRNLADAVQAEFFKRPQGHQSFTHYYPWESYYSTKEVEKNPGAFAIWNIHGTIRYQKSIKLGLSDYMGMVHRAKELISKDLFSNRGKNASGWAGARTWLNIFFHQSLLIFGLGLSREEVFLRWLLTERAKFLKKINDERKQRGEPAKEIKGWYVHIGQEKEIDYGKSLFLKSVGIEVLTLPGYDHLYKKPWN